MNKLLFIIGNNIDKKKMDEVNQKIAKDGDIRCLINIGNLDIIIRIMVILVAVGVIVCSNITNEWNLQFTTSGLLVGSITFYSLCGDLVEMKENSISLVNYIKYIFSKSRPYSPLEIWKFIQGSVADIQLVNTCKSLCKDEIDIMYAGQPYYETIFINSITIRWNDEGKIKWLRALKHRKRYIRYFRQYAQRTIVAMADKRYFVDENKHVEYSNSVFGILFTSGYLKEEINYKNEKDLIRIKINISEKEKRRYAKEWLQYCTTPEIFCFVDDNDSKYDLEITGIDTSSSIKDKQKKKRLTEIRIPVKRFIAIPTRYKGIDVGPFPGVIDLDKVHKVIVIGGAEQNLALQCLINSYRWDKKNKEYIVGFAENEFEHVRSERLLVGTEGLVYGVRQDIIERMSGRSEVSCKAEVYRLLWPSNKRLNNINMYGVYGYSAMATKMTLCYFIYNMYGNSDNSSEYEPGKYVKFKELLDYELTGESDKPIFKTRDGRDWDCKDYMNDINALKTWFKRNNNESHIKIL